MTILETLFTAVVLVAASCFAALLIFATALATVRQMKKIWKGEIKE